MQTTKAPLSGTASLRGAQVEWLSAEGPCTGGMDAQPHSAAAETAEAARAAQAERFISGL